MEIPSSMQLCEGTTVELREATTKEAGVRPFRMKAYSGAPVRTFFGSKLVIDLAGMRLGKKKKPILQHHDPTRVVGFSQSVELSENTLQIEGQVLEKMDAGREVITASDGGFDWQASIGFTIDKARYIEEGDSETVNGKEFKGPGVVVTKSRLRESSFVPIGADENTSSVVLGESKDGRIEVENSKESDMPKEKGKDDAALSAEAVDKARAEGADEAGKAGRVRLAALREAFPDRAEFVLDQMAKGHDVPAAKVELADILIKEQGEGAKEMAELKAKNAELTKKVDGLEAGHEGVPVKPGGAGVPAGVELKAGCDAEAVARAQWDANADGCQDQFGKGGFEHFEGYIVNEVRLLDKKAGQASAA